MTEWMSIVVVVDPVEVDLVSGLVWDLGVSGIEEQPLPDGAVELRIGCEKTIAQHVLTVLAERWAPNAEPVAADEGLDAWRDHAQVWRIGSTVIVPPWLETPIDVDENDLVIVIDPGHAFGSASHETTRMCLEAVHRMRKRNIGDRRSAPWRNDGGRNRHCCRRNCRNAR